MSCACNLAFWLTVFVCSTSFKIYKVHNVHLIVGHGCRDEELATEMAWVVVYLSALSNTATNMLIKTDIIQLLVERLATSDSLQLLIPVTSSW